MTIDLTGLLDKKDALHLDEVETFLAKQNIRADLTFDPDPGEAKKPSATDPRVAADDPAAEAALPRPRTLPETITFNGQLLSEGELAVDLGLLEKAQAFDLEEGKAGSGQQALRVDLTLAPNAEGTGEQAGNGPLVSAGDPAGITQQLLDTLQQTTARGEEKDAVDTKDQSQTEKTKAAVEAFSAATQVAVPGVASLIPPAPTPLAVPSPIPAPPSPLAPPSLKSNTPPPLAQASPSVSQPVSPLAITQQKIKDASLGVSGHRAEIGNQIRANEALSRVHSNALLNTLEAKSQIEDLDYAQATSELARTEILVQANAQALAISLHEHRRVLDLLTESVQSNRCPA